MAKEVSIEDIEDGEISDNSQSAVVEEEEVLSRDDCRVWNGGNLFNYAWAQAVRNKPLNESLLREFELNSGRTTKSIRPAKSNAKKDSNVVVTADTNKVVNDEEEGELEEGEIVLDDSFEQDDLFDSKLKLIRDALDTVTVNGAKKSIDEICGRIRTCLDNLGLILSKNGDLEVGDLIDKSFVAIKSVFESKQHEQKKEGLSRLVDHMKTQLPSLFSQQQMKEIQAAMDSLVSPPVSSSIKDIDIVMETELTREVKNDVHIQGGQSVLMNSSQEDLLEPIVTKPEMPNNSAIASQKQELVFGTGSKTRGSFSPLIDLHSDHDIDSLPSPTKEAPPPVHFQEQQTMGDVKPVFVSKVDDISIHPNADVKSEVETGMHSCEPEVTSVTTYQQNDSQSSFLLSSRLPSPTPSEENNDDNDHTTEEVSSRSTGAKVHLPVPLPEIAPHMDKSSGQQALPSKTTIGQNASSPNIRVALRSRDPRIRLLNPEIRPSLRDTPKIEAVEGMINLRKNKYVGDHPDDHAFKKQKNGAPSWDALKDVRFGGLATCNSTGVMVSDRPQSTTDPRKSENRGISSSDMQSNSSLNAKIGGTVHLPTVGTSTTSSVPSLLKDIAGNSTMFVQLVMEQQQQQLQLVMEQHQQLQRLAAESQSSSNLSQIKTPTSNLNPTLGSTPRVNVAPSKPTGNPQTNSQTSLMNAQGEGPKICLKPRDPRRILFSNTFQNNEILGAEKFGVRTSASQTSNDKLNVRQQTAQAQTTSFLSQSCPPPDITPQFTKNLRNIADILSSQSTNSDLTVAGNGSSQLISSMVDKVDVGVQAKDSKDHQRGTIRTPIGAIETSRPQSNSWRDVEHLFGAYDEHQKVAIQRERIRRIEEQNKMFAAKKLCLVLDLDHTLLNSAKFVEVEPAHEEILRKKEEQDREKPWRHLFRLSHMGMWTKLRPGIWTFLEKASKLYELHLYTMGNYSYATEMAKLLDPTGTLFAGRVIAKGDDGDPFDSDDKIPKCKDLEGVLGMESAVVIIDDSVKVWPHNKLNLIAVERYTYFPSSRRQFGLLGPSLLEVDHDERPNEGTLASSFMVIERIHRNFFSNPSLHEVDVRNILAAEQRKILSGCRILFSRIFPVGEAKPHQHPLWQTAEQFGAVCTTQIDNLVTHVVALSLGTDKVNWGLSTGRYVVHPGWVEASALLYRRASEKDFAIKINMSQVQNCLK